MKKPSVIPDGASVRSPLNPAEKPPALQPAPRNTKRTGELSEAAFLLKAESLGFHLSRPWGDSERYDFILDTGPRLWRVQLKCTAVIRARGYDIQPTYSIYGQGKFVYTAAEIDTLVVHILPIDTWYVLPIEAFAPSKSLRFYPDIECKRARWENYREAWQLLRPEGPRLDPNLCCSIHGRPTCPRLGEWRQCYLRGLDLTPSP